MFGLPLVALSLITTQLILASYCNNVALEAAVDGATAAAWAGGGGQLGRSVAIKSVSAQLPNANAQVNVDRRSLGVATWQATVSLEVPVFWFGLMPISQSAEVIDEEQ
jgi:hypothetical protein